MSKKKFNETKVGKFLVGEKGLFTNLADVVPDKGFLGLLKNLILKDDNITVNCLHPGVVATGFASQNDSKFQKFLFKLSKPFMRSSNKGAETSIYLSSSDDVSDVSGKYFYNSKVSKISFTLS